MLHLFSLEVFIRENSYRVLYYYSYVDLNTKKRNCPMGQSPGSGVTLSPTLSYDGHVDLDTEKGCPLSGQPFSILYFYNVLTQITLHNFGNFFFIHIHYIGNAADLFRFPGK